MRLKVIDPAPAVTPCPRLRPQGVGFYEKEGKFNWTERQALYSDYRNEAGGQGLVSLREAEGRVHWSWTEPGEWLHYTVSVSKQTTKKKSRVLLLRTSRWRKENSIIVVAISFFTLPFFSGGEEGKVQGL